MYEDGNLRMLSEEPVARRNEEIESQKLEEKLFEINTKVGKRDELREVRGKGIKRRTVNFEKLCIALEEMHEESGLWEREQKREKRNAALDERKEVVDVMEIIEKSCLDMCGCKGVYVSAIHRRESLWIYWELKMKNFFGGATFPREHFTQLTTGFCPWLPIFYSLG